jgi:hypothetical protein
VISNHLLPAIVIQLIPNRAALERGKAELHITLPLEVSRHSFLLANSAPFDTVVTRVHTLSTAGTQGWQHRIECTTASFTIHSFVVVNLSVSCTLRMPGATIESRKRRRVASEDDGRKARGRPRVDGQDETAADVSKVVAIVT